MTTVDAVFARALMALIVVEYFADGQQWNYHQAKKSYQDTAKVRCVGCLTLLLAMLTAILRCRYLKAGQEPKWTVGSTPQDCGSGADIQISPRSKPYGWCSMLGVVIRRPHTTTGLARE